MDLVGRWSKHNHIVESVPRFFCTPFVDDDGDDDDDDGDGDGDGGEEVFAIFFMKDANCFSIIL